MRKLEENKGSSKKYIKSTELFSNIDLLRFNEIFFRYHKKVYYFSLKCLKNKEDAECVVQDVFLSLWQDRDKLMQAKNPDAWIFAICMNTIRNMFRKMDREQKILSRISTQHNMSSGMIDTNVEYNELTRQVETIITKLPERLRTIYLLSRNDQLNNQKISEKTGKSIKTVENYLSEAKNKIKQELKNKGLIA